MQPEKNLHAAFPPDLLAKMQAAAERRHISVEEWLKETVEHRLNHQEFEEVLAFGKPHAQERGLKPSDVEDAADAVRDLARREQREPGKVLQDAIRQYAAMSRLERFSDKMAKRAREKGIREEDVPDLVRRVRREEQHRER
jgi:predicted transcriptional regulator